MLIDPDNFPRVDHDFMNRVHEEEVTMLNRLADLVTRRNAEPAAQDDIDALLSEFLDHMRKHFADEEAMMRRIAFPPYPIHKQEHDRILEALDQLHQRPDPRELEHFLLEEIPHWLGQHVATMDMVTARFLAMQEVTEPGDDGET